MVYYLKPKAIRISNTNNIWHFESRSINLIMLNLLVYI